MIVRAKVLACSARHSSAPLPDNIVQEDLAVASIARDDPFPRAHMHRDRSKLGS